MTTSGKLTDLVNSLSNVIFIQSSDNAAYALSMLDKYHIASAPVIGDDQKIWGFVDILDIVVYLVHTLQKQGTNIKPSQLDSESVVSYLETCAEFNTAPISQIIDFSRRNPYYPIDEGASIKEVVDIFLKGPHRLAVTNQFNKIVSIVSQTDLIKWLAKDTTSLGFAAQKTASSIMKKVISVSPDAKAIEAFSLMSEKNLTSIAIVDNDALVGVISAADLKNISGSKVSKVFQPISKFIAEVRKDQAKKANYIVTCAANAPLKDIVTKLAEEHVHRVFILDEAKTPVGVISQSDIVTEVFA